MHTPPFEKDRRINTKKAGNYIRSNAMKKYNRSGAMRKEGEKSVEHSLITTKGPDTQFGERTINAIMNILLRK